METLHFRIEKRGRNGKTVTIIEGFTRRSQEVDELARKVKSALGAGGTVKNGCIEIQGDFQKQIPVLFQELGFQVTDF